MSLWMETYFFYCSVRLGVIVVSIITFLQLFIPAIVFLILGIHTFDGMISLFQKDDKLLDDQLYVVNKLIGWLETDPDNFLLILNIGLFLHMALCIVAIYGALKLQKWFLLPFIIFELFRVVSILFWHIIFMIALKKKLNLGFLITVTLAGGFIILYLGYNWASAVALFQIINLIRTERYRALYGDDPFVSPISSTRVQNVLPTYGTIENVRVLVTPNTHEIHEQKLLNAAAQLRQTPLAVRQPIIAVIPMQQPMSVEGMPLMRYNQRLRQAELAAEQQRNNYNNHQNYNYNSQFNNNFTNYNHNNNHSNINDVNTVSDVEFGNWQWSELLSGVNQQRPRVPQQRWK